MSDSPTYTTRNGRPDEVEAIAALMQAGLGAGQAPRTVEYWRWKHQNSPFGASPVRVAVAGDDPDSGALVGLRVFSRWSWRCDAGDVTAVRPVDTATHPEWRRRGIFRRLTTELVEQAQAEGTGFIFNTPNAQSGPGYLKMGWSHVEDVRVRISPVRPARLAIRLRRGGDLREVPLTDDGSIRRLLEERGLDTFLDACGDADPRYQTPIDRAFVRWRFADVPGFIYRALWSFSGTSGAVVLFRRRTRRGLDELSVSEVLLGPDAASERTAVELLMALRKAAPVDHLMAISPGGTRAGRALSRALFVPAPPKIHMTLMARPLAQLPAGVPEPTHAASWNVTLGDLELF